MAKCREREKTISFRLGSPYLERLEERVQGTNLSRHQVARLALVTHFEETAVHRCADEVEELRREVARLGGTTSGDGKADERR